jgi:TatD DNase family protein
MRAIDTHAHLEFPQFDHDREQLIAELSKQEIGVITIATSKESNNETDRLTKRHPLVWGTLGIHPTDINSKLVTDLPKLLDRFSEQLSANTKLVAIGEIGLDYFREKDAANIQEQKVVLRALLQFAQEKDLPIIVHCREAYGDILTILSDYPKVRGVIHCFNGNREQLQKFLALGYYISYTGMLTYPANEQLRTDSLLVPLDKLLLETDAPFLSPQAKRGERNDPRSIEDIAIAHAKLRDASFDEILTKTTENAVRLFTLEER